MFADVIAVKYAFGMNDTTSSVLGKMYNVRVELPAVGMTQLDVAVAASAAKERKHPCVVDALMMRYWLPPSVIEGHCTGVGADVAAVNLTVFPVTV